MTDAIIIELPSRTAGIAVRERGGYRFYASERVFHAMDDRTFPRLRDLRAALDRVAANGRAQEQGIPPKQQAGKTRRAG
jgi:hypothetical protein